MMEKGRKRVLTEDDEAQIFDLSERGRTTGQIARKLGRNASTVKWFQLQNGLIRVVLHADRGSTHTAGSGRVTRRYSEAEDRLLLTMRIGGKPLAAIVAAIEQQFGHRRTGHSLQVRLVMLANSDWADELSAELLRKEAA